MHQPSYPFIRFILAYGARLADAVGLSVAVVCLVAIHLSGLALWTVLPALGCAAGTWMLLRSYGEVVAVISDMLLPK